MTSLPLPSLPPAADRARLRLDPGITAAIIWLAFIAIVVALPGLVAPGDPIATNLGASLLPPSLENPFGTDRLGRDVYTRTIHGAQYSLLIGVASTLLALVIGVLLGLAAGLGGRFWNEAISRFFDVIGGFPDLLLALVLIAFTGPGTWNLIVAIGVASAPRFGRVVRAGTLAVRESGYVQQARLMIVSPVRLAFRHVLPNALGALPVLATLGIGSSILGAAGLSYLGFGPQQPLPEWGSMLSEARGDLRLAWWASFFPGLFITLCVIAVTVVGRRLQRRFERRDAA